MKNKTMRFELRLTAKEKDILKRKARKLKMTASEYVRTTLIHSDNLNVTMLDTTSLENIARELLKQGVNLNQLMRFLNTYGVDAYNEEQVSKVLAAEGEIYQRVSNAIGDLRDEAEKHHVYIQNDGIDNGDEPIPMETEGEND